MIYDIESKSDFQTGAALVVRMPEADVDKKAFNTILFDLPAFVLPFSHRFVEGQIELTYQIGNRSKLAYLSGNRTPGDYVDMWLAILQPLLNCGNWFMNPFSFVLNPEHLYFDKTRKSVSYVYIPSKQACSDNDTLKSMVTDIAKKNNVSDINLENKVIWAIQDFNPNEFLQLIKPYKSNINQGIVNRQTPPAPIPSPPPGYQPAQNVLPTQNAQASRQTPLNIPSVPQTPATTQKKPDDISINLSNNGKALKSEKPKGGLFGSKKVKEPKPIKESKKTGKEKNKKKGSQQDIIQGAVAEIPLSPVTPGPAREQWPYQGYAAPNYSQPISVADDLTYVEKKVTGTVKLRYVGIGNHPDTILVDIAVGGLFTIGRFDVSVGKKQSDFEFEQKTKAVSRRHAAIERSSGGYSIVDMDSSAGTFLNGQKLPPNAPFKLENGCRVSFGHSGADYIWDE